MKNKLILLLIVVCGLVGCKNDRKESPYELIAFYPLEGTDDSAFRIYEVSMKRYFHESIEDMFKRNDSLFGMKLLGHWVGNDSIWVYRDSITLTVDTIRKTRQTGWASGAAFFLATDSAGNIIEVPIDTTSGLDYKWEMVRSHDTTSVGLIKDFEVNDTKIKSVWTDGVRLSPKRSKLLDKDTIYIYRDTCATDYNKPGDYKIELHEAGVTTESGGLFLKPIRFIIANGYDDYAIRHSSTGKWEIYDCEKALEQWFIYDSTLKADNIITVTSKPKK